MFPLYISVNIQGTRKGYFYNNLCFFLSKILSLYETFYPYLLVVSLILKVNVCLSVLLFPCKDFQRINLFEKLPP